MGIILRKNLDSIGSKAFLSCNKLTSVSVPKSVKTVGEDAFGKISGEEKIEDMQKFDADEFVDALFEPTYKNK